MRIKHQIITATLLGLWQGACVAQPQMNDDAIVLYSLGYELGEDMRKQQLELNQEIILQGIKDALGGSKPLFGLEVQRQAIASLQAQRAERNLKKAEAFLAENKTRDGITTLASGLQYKVITAGDGKIPGIEDTVLLNFRGTLMDGTEFASTTSQGKPASLRINRTTKGLSEALQLMPTGSKWEIYIHPELGFGKRSPGAKVPANSGLIYEVELLSIK
jgi:FKBP-type peptidyl-prolyl cis-trans isomerase FklB